MRLDTGKTLLAICLTVGALSCRSAAELFLDISEPPGNEQYAPAANVSQSQSVMLAVPTDTARPPIESVDGMDSVLVMLPQAPDGSIDWVTAIRDTVIRPRNAPRGVGSVRESLSFDFYFGEFETYFPHSAHAEWMECTSCHPTIYRRRGASTSMKEIGEGQSCGRCHGSVAFSTAACERCHTAMKLPEGRQKPNLGAVYTFSRSETATNIATDSVFPPAVFSHGFHRIRYTCAACHNDLFPMARSAPGTVTMKSIQNGEACGTCHNGSTAFGVLQCGLCHQKVESDSEGSGP
jgi:c(7)-type cytochrome triheme protein